MAGVNYLLACYLGERRTRSVKDPITFVKTNLDWFERHKPDIDRLSIILNARDVEDVNRMIKTLQEYRPFYTELKLYARSNIGYSYGAWSDTINASIDAGEDFSYFVLVEDDYRPNRRDFLEVLKSKLDGKNAYAAQKVYEGVLGGFPRHAAVCTGMLDGNAAREIKKMFGSVLRTDNATSYSEAEWDQLHFLDNLERAGYTYTDTSDVAGIRFLQKERRNGYDVIRVDIANGTPLFEPIYEEL